MSSRSAFVTTSNSSSRRSFAITAFHDTAQFPDGQLHVVEGDTGLESHGVEQHLRSEWDRNGTSRPIRLGGLFPLPSTMITRPRAAAAAVLLLAPVPVG